ncbi:MYXO-CTERM domain-containing protein [Paenibacillus forsythiae]|uniref:MYXO-CTERM domain-containing protein n=1 Tax=Paenibacillus forsythiae TaxID=365616 RepID=A0ABU3H6J7_9BACL|nr:WGxxGxxG family protein [Paenibacillus forsythiae]MDT3426442.1 MYXO-CTERM domain-containing protein [Paenibacillus forsythiae]
MKKKLMASLACSAVVSMSLMGAGYADHVSAAAERSVTISGTEMTANRTVYPTGTGTTYTNDNTINGRTDGTVTPLGTTRTGTYRAANTAPRTNYSNWGWLGLLGLFGLVGMRNRSGERR